MLSLRRTPNKLASFYLAVAVVLFFRAQAGAASLTVTNAGDTHVDGQVTLREAVAASGNGDTIVFAVGPVNLTQGEITIDHDLSIEGSAPYLQTIYQATFVAPNFRIFSVNQGTVVVFTDLRLSHGVVATADATATASVQTAQGGGVKNLGNLTVIDCEFSGCDAHGGSGFGNAANKTGGAGQGGAIFNGGALTVERSVFFLDRALGGRGGDTTTSIEAGSGGAAEGGAIYNEGTALITNSTFFQLSAAGGPGGGADTGTAAGTGGLGTGGAIFNVGTLTLINATVSQNSANAGAGGLVGTLFPTDKDGMAQGGGLAVSGAGIGHTFVRNTIIAGNASGRGIFDVILDQQGQDVFSSVNSTGYNLIGIAEDSSGWLPTDQLGTSADPIDPQLGHPFHNNGGPTVTLTLEPSSRAVDQGGPSTLATDQRGLPRVLDNPAVANSSGGDGTDIGAFELQPAPPSRVVNLSTRAQVLTGDRVLIGGTIITGTISKKILFRVSGFTAGLALLNDPTLELRGANGELIAFNDNWRDTQQSEIEDAGLGLVRDLDSALIQTLAPGPYTAIVRGKSNTTGVGLLEMYDLTYADPTVLANVSSRALVGTGDNVAIAGMILGSGGGGSTQIMVRGLGPSLSNLGVAGLLEDPVLELYDEDGTLLRTNDNWKDNQRTAIEATGIPPANDQEAALVETLAPGSYTAVLRGKNDSTGVGIIEVYRLQ